MSEMLKLEQRKLVRQAVKDKADSYSDLIRKENAKKQEERDLKEIDQLTEMYHQHNLILDELQREEF